MKEILAALPAGAIVLDLGCRAGSFNAPEGLQVGVDLESPMSPGLAVQADAARLPFCGHAFDALISNHSLEHFCGDRVGAR